MLTFNCERRKFVVVANCGTNNVALQALGSWEFDHCTFANYFNEAARETPAFFVQNAYNSFLGLLIDTPRVSVRNSIIYGNEVSEFNTEVINNGGVQGKINLTFLNTILKTDQDVSDTSSFKNIINNPEDQIFINTMMSDFELNETSVARNRGNIQVGNTVPVDFNGNNRTMDGQPDLGAFEFGN